MREIGILRESVLFAGYIVRNVGVFAYILVEKALMHLIFLYFTITFPNLNFILGEDPYFFCVFEKTLFLPT